MKRFKFLLFIAVLVGFAALAHAGFDEGKAAYDRGDFATAYKEFRILAEQGDAQAQCYLGTLYKMGFGVPQDDAEALKWYRKSAGQRYAPAQYHLGAMYREGVGVPKDFAQAYMWFDLAAAQHFVDAAKDINATNDRDAVAAKMTADEIAQAQRLAEKWLKQEQAPGIEADSQVINQQAGTRTNLNAQSAPIAIAAPQLGNEFDSNEIAAEGKYKNRLLAITGIIENFRKGPFGGTYVDLSTGQMFSAVHCEFKEGYDAQLAQYRKGAKITIMGTCKGMILGSVMLDDCHLSANTRNEDIGRSETTNGRDQAPQTPPSNVYHPTVPSSVSTTSETAPTSGDARAQKEADSNRLIKVYSNKNNNYYIPEHIVKSNLESGHSQNGNLHVLLYEDFNEVMRRGVIGNIERGVGNGSIVPSKKSPSNPNLVKYQVLDLTLDQNTKMVSLKETIFIDENGSTIATQIADETFPLDSKKYQTLSNAIHGVIGVLEKAKNGQGLNYQPPGNENKAPIRQEKLQTKPTAAEVIRELRSRDPSKSVAEKRAAPAQQSKREIIPLDQDAQSVRQDYQAQLAQMETFLQHTLDGLTLSYDATIKIYPQAHDFFEYRIYVKVPSNVFDSLYIPPRRTLSEFIRIAPCVTLAAISEGKRYLHVLAYTVVEGSNDNSHYKFIGDCLYMYPGERMRCSDTMTVSNYEIPIF